MVLAVDGEHRGRAFAVHTLCVVHQLDRVTRELEEDLLVQHLEACVLDVGVNAVCNQLQKTLGRRIATATHTAKLATLIDITDRDRLCEHLVRL